ncbi:MAG: Hpt domain-containing protein [Lentisphaerae bacterium]|nr:MAG: Hpt domain-containing protein [Lentisphaerota bacterium]
MLPQDHIDERMIAHVMEVGGKSFLSNLIHMFFNTFDERKQTIEEAIARNDRDVAYRQIHGIRSGAVNLGLTKVVQYCNEIEAGIERLSHEDIALHFKKLQEEIVFVRKILNDYLEE